MANSSIDSISTPNDPYQSKGRLKAELVPITLDERSHPLHVFVSPHGARLLGLATAPDNLKTFFISVTVPKLLGKYENTVSQIDYSDDPNGLNSTTPSLDTAGKSIVCCVWVTGGGEEGGVENGIDTSQEEQPGVVYIYCSRAFLHHYRLTTMVFVRRIKLHAVEHVVIGVKDHKTFKALQNIEFSSGLLCQICANPVLVRSDDAFLAPLPGDFLTKNQFSSSIYFNVEVLECAPLSQGLLSVNTSMVISFSDFSTLSPQIELDPRSNSGPFMSDFCQPIRQSSMNEQDTDVDCVNLYFRIKEFSYDLVKQESKWEQLVEKRDENWPIDPNYFIGMSKRDMLDNSLFDGALVVTRISAEEQNERGYPNVPQRLGVVRCINRKKSKDHNVLISPLLLFNLGQRETKDRTSFIQIQKYRGGAGHDESGSRSPLGSSDVPVAKELVVAIISSPMYSTGSDLKAAQEKYFIIPRLVCKGDVIPIKSSDAPEFWHNLNTDTESRYPIFFFKVTKVTGFHEDSNSTAVPCVYRTDERTSLLQAGSEHSYVPLQMISYLSTDKLGYWDSPKLPGLDRYVEKLKSCIIPHIQHRLDSPGMNLIYPAILLSGPVGCGKTSTIMAAANLLSMHVRKVSCHSVYGEAVGATEARLKNVFNSANTFSPCILLLQNLHALGKDRDSTLQDPRIANSFTNSVKELHLEVSDYPIIIVGTTNAAKEITQDLLDIFLHEIKFEAPCESERAEMLQGLVESVSYSGDLSIPYIAQRTAGCVLGDMVALVSQALRESYRRICKHCAGRAGLELEEEDDILAAGVVLQQASFIDALDKLQAAHSDAIGAPKIPNVTWGDIGGLADVKSEILDTVQLPLQYPELLAAGLRRSGVLLYGPPGTGKTLMAKAIATECSLNFLSVKGPELINMYVGQSEENVREVFNRARSATPCVIFFDELDSLAPNRGKSGDSGGVMDRIVSQLLAELDGLHKSCDVFVIGATNRPDLLDPALIRPGRFDKMLYLGVPEDHYSQLRILHALTRKFTFADDFELAAIANKCPLNLTGADLYALCSDALLNAAKRMIKLLDSGKEVDQTRVIVEKQDFLDALSTLTPSVSHSELLHYKEMQKNYNKKD
ncbi:hypothetical protein ScPMuIL_014170 [Solemya velum]